MKLKLFILFIPLLIVADLAYGLTIPYGKSGRIVYDLQKGTFDVFEGDLQILYNGFSTAKNKDQVLSSKSYGQIDYEKVGIKDQFGSGNKYILHLKHAGLPDMKQVFYTYVNRPYFLCEILLEGKALSSNGMTPIQGVIQTGDQSTGLSSLFVPFDNDTFISYDVKPVVAGLQNWSSEITSVYNNKTRNGLVAGSVEHEIWKTGVKTSLDERNVLSLEIMAGYTEQSLTRDAIAHGSISGDRIRSAKIFFGKYADWRVGMEDYAKANRIAEPPVVFKWTKPTPVGWNSWGVMQEKISYDKVTAVVDFFADSLKGFRSGGTAYIDLDSYWDKMIKGGLEGDFSKLKAFADYAKKRGLKPGAYWAPFTDWGYKSGGDRRAEGGTYKYGEMWTKVAAGYHDLDGARALDPTHPGTQKRIALVIGKLKDCGFEMIKIDFLGHAAIESTHFYDPKITTGMQAYKEGMEYLLKQMDDKMLVYAAISPSMASGRYVHARRIACDAFKSIKDTEYTLNSVTNGWWQTYLYDYLDADHVVLNNEPKGANTARLLSAVVTGTIIVGDDFSVKGQWTAMSKELFQNRELISIIKDGKSFRPVEGNNGKSASALFVKQIGNSNYLVAFNYTKDKQSILIDRSRFGMPTTGKLQAVDLIDHNMQSFENDSFLDVAPESARIFKISQI